MSNKVYIAQRGNRIGKKMRDALHIHKSAIDTLTDEEKKLIEEKIKYIGDFNFEVVKITLSKEEVAFVQSPDWNEADEPLVGDRITVTKDNEIKKSKGRNLIYHHKWMMVKDDYEGFNVEQSKERSEYWMNHPIVLELKNNPNEKFNSKIGRRIYWENNVCNHLKNK